MALHMICVRIRPEAPTSEPATMSSGFCTANPAIEAATPDSEFSSEITTGMSAPPIGSVAVTPTISARTRDRQHHDQGRCRGSNGMKHSTRPASSGAMSMNALSAVAAAELEVVAPDRAVEFQERDERTAQA